MGRPSSLHEHLVDRIGRLIVTGEFGAGGVLPREDELAVRFAVSRTVIREVTKTLQAIGLITTGPRVGSRVQPLASWRLLDPRVLNWLTDADMASGFERDLLELRGMIEPAAAAFAAERGSPAHVQAVTDALAGMAAATTKAGHEAADFRFHEAILIASGNLLLIQLTPVLNAVLKASFRLSMHDHQRAQASIAIHRKVADAIVARRPEEAREAMIALLQTARDDIAFGPPNATAGSTKPRKKDQGTLDDRTNGKMGFTRA